MDWSALLKILVSAVCSSGVVIALIMWRRHRKQDAAKADKDLAEAEKVRQEAAMLKLERDERIFEVSIKLVDKLSKECEATKQELELTQDELFKIRETLVNMKAALHDSNKRCMELEESLNREREKNRACQIEIEQLRIELEKYRREESRRGPS